MLTESWVDFRRSPRRYIPHVRSVQILNRMRRGQADASVSCDHETGDIKLIRYSKEEVSEGTMCSDEFTVNGTVKIYMTTQKE
jgi:hypothetical protein